jgi:hypothetical protein
MKPLLFALVGSLIMVSGSAAFAEEPTKSPNPSSPDRQQDGTQPSPEKKDSGKGQEQAPAPSPIPQK